jgi:class 3 adenylate cyclase
VRRLAPLDLALLLVLAPLWAVALGLHATLALRGDLAWVPIEVRPADGPAGYPTLVAFWPGVQPEVGELSPGARLLRVGAADLAGAGRVGFLLRAYEQAHGPQPPTLTFDRNGARAEAPLPMLPVGAPWRTIPVAATLGVTAALALWRSRGSRAARAFAVAAFVYALVWALFTGGPGWLAVLGLGTMGLGGMLFQPLVLRAIQLFPDSAAAPRGLARAAPWVFLLAGPLLSSWLLGVPLASGLGMRLLFVVYGVFFVAVLALLAQRYRAAEAIGRRQLRWVIYGFAVGLLPPLVISTLSSIDPGFWPLYEPSLVATLAIPVCICVALLRHNLFDIDRLITSTAAFSLLSIFFLAALLALAPRLGERIGTGVGIDAAAAQMAVSVLLAAVLVPSRRWLRGPLEQLFFRERAALQRGAEQLRVDLASLGGAREVLETLGSRLHELLRLRGCAIYGDAGDAFVAVFAEGPVVPPAFARDGGLAELLEERGSAVGEEDARRWARRRLRGAERAALEALGPSVILPILRGEELVAFVCLGEKGSGDVYTPTDLALLEGVADRAALALSRLDAAALRAEERSMNEALRSYVPEAVAAELERGARFEPGEQEVSVLFVDVRGYTSFAEGRTPAEIFSAINAYTTEASAVVGRHGGAVVEFHGDGLLAVFGAPRALADKERCAVGAGLEIVAAVEALRIGAGAAGADGLSVGVGIATGEVYVGDIQAVDRRIWSAIGNTTNLAARLEALTRELGAAMVIDDPTRTRAGATADDFVAHDDVRIRGRSEPMRIWVRAR